MSTKPDRKSVWCKTGVIIALISGCVTIVVAVIQLLPTALGLRILPLPDSERTSPVLPPPPIVEPGYIPTTPSDLCGNVYKETGPQKSLTITKLVVPKDCVLVVNSYRGNLNNTEWSTGAVLAFRSGEYSGRITDGAYEIASPLRAKHLFCFRVFSIQNQGGALTYKLPLPEWKSCDSSDQTFG